MGRVAHQDGAAHGVRQRHERRRAVGQHDVLHEAQEVLVELGEIPDVTLERVGERALRAALPAPVERCHGEAAAAQIGDHLEILFDVLATALEQAHRATPGAAGRAPDRIAQRRLVEAGKFADAGAARHRVLGQRNEFHAIPDATSARSPRETRRGRVP